MGQRGPRPTKAAAITRATLSLLAERGVRGATMRAIARRAHTTEGNLYRYYPNKRELVGHVLGGCLQEFGEYIAQALAGVTMPGERLALFVSTYLAYAERLPLQGRAMFEAGENGSNGGAEKPSPRHVLVEVLEDGMEQGAFPRENACRLASFIMTGLAEAAPTTTPDAEGQEWLVRAVQKLVGRIA